MLSSSIKSLIENHYVAEEDRSQWENGSVYKPLVDSHLLHVCEGFTQDHSGGNTSHNYETGKFRTWI